MDRDDIAVWRKNPCGIRADPAIGVRPQPALLLMAQPRLVLLRHAAQSV
jgi:hypothetical protein